ncbi:MAG TPA: AbrB/MazE/SpoVT family DNA-binding domain-containing protein [Candidatus Obscuribacterales bacterium]
MAHNEQFSEPKDYTVEVGARGRIVLPAEIRRNLGLAEGDELIISVLPDQTMRLASRKALAAKYLGIYKHLSAKKSLVDDLIADRRREAQNE